MTGKSDKDLFPCAYPEWDEKRVSSTFWDDFTIADAFGTTAVRDTFDRAFREWSSNYRMLTELSVVLNHKLWLVPPRRGPRRVREALRRAMEAR